MTVLTPGVPPLVAERVTADRVPALLRLLHGADGHASRPPRGRTRHPVPAARSGARRAVGRIRRPLDDAPTRGAAALAGAFKVLARRAAVKTLRLLDAAAPTSPPREVAASAGAPAPQPCRQQRRPGTGRHLMEADLHRLLEGMLLAAAAGASRGILTSTARRGSPPSGAPRWARGARRRPLACASSTPFSRSRRDPARRRRHPRRGDGAPGQRGSAHAAAEAAVPGGGRRPRMSHGHQRRDAVCVDRRRAPRGGAHKLFGLRPCRAAGRRRAALPLTPRT